MDKKKQTQVGKVWEHLQKNTSITREEAVKLGVYDLSKAIYKLKKNLSNGYSIKVEKSKLGLATYTLIKPEVKEVEVKQEAKQETEQAKNGSYLLLKTLMELKEQLRELNENISEYTEQLRELNENISEHTEQLRELNENVSELSDRIREH